jgi:hypothetical protein
LSPVPPGPRTMPRRSYSWTVLEEREAPLHQRNVHDLAAAATKHVPPVERGEDALHGEHARDRIAERDVKPGRRLARKSVDVADAAHRLRHGGEARPRCVRPGLAVAGDARDDESRVHLPELVRPDPPLLERAGAEVLDEDVAVLDEVEQQLLPSLLPQVECDALLVARLHRPPEGAPLVARLAPLAQRVRLPRWLDLDDLGAHVAEQPAGEGTGEQHAELDDADAGERAGPVALALRSRGGDCGIGHSSPSSSRQCARSRSRASKMCSFMISSARSASRVSSARVICEW